MRIHITSRRRTPSSGSPSDFHFALERPIERLEGARGHIDSFACSSVREPVLAGVNAKLYCQWSGGVQRIATLEAGDVQNAAQLETEFQTAITNLGGPHAVSVTAVGNRIQFNCLGLSKSETFTVFARTSLLNGSAPYTAQPNGFLDACGLIGALTSNLVCLSTTTAAAAGANRTPQALSQFINLSPYQTLYLHSHIGTTPTGQMGSRPSSPRSSQGTRRQATWSPTITTGC